jgi:Flp pilus assembly protein TadG
MTSEGVTCGASVDRQYQYKQENVTQMNIKKHFFIRQAKVSRDSRGQGLVETAIASVVLTLMVAVAANFAYLAYLNGSTSSATRQAAITAIQGAQSPAGTTLPLQSTACAVASNEVNNWLAVSSEDWAATVASAPVGSSSWSQTTGCTGGNAASATFAADPESDYFGSTAVAVTGNYNMPLQFSIWGIGSVARNVLQTSHTLYVRQLN